MAEQPVSGEVLYLPHQRYPVQQILYKAKGAEEAAYEPAAKCAAYGQESQDIKGYAIASTVKDCLEGAYGAGKQCPWTGIAVESRYTELLEAASVDLALHKASHISVRQGKKGCLYDMTQDSLLFS